MHPYVYSAEHLTQLTELSTAAHDNTTIRQTSFDGSVFTVSVVASVDVKPWPFGDSDGKHCTGFSHVHGFAHGLTATQSANATGSKTCPAFEVIWLCSRLADLLAPGILKTIQTA